MTYPLKLFSTDLHSQPTVLARNDSGKLPPQYCCKSGRVHADTKERGPRREETSMEIMKRKDIAARRHWLCNNRDYTFRTICVSKHEKCNLNEIFDYTVEPRRAKCPE